MAKTVTLDEVTRLFNELRTEMNANHIEILTKIDNKLTNLGTATAAPKKRAMKSDVTESAAPATPAATSATSAVTTPATPAVASDGDTVKFTGNAMEFFKKKVYTGSEDDLQKYGVTPEKIAAIRADVAKSNKKDGDKLVAEAAKVWAMFTTAQKDEFKIQLQKFNSTEEAPTTKLSLEAPDSPK